MKRIRIKGAASLTWAHELVEDQDGGGFYIKVYPKLGRFRAYRDSQGMKEIAEQVLTDIKKNKSNGKVKVK